MVHRALRRVHNTWTIIHCTWHRVHWYRVHNTFDMCISTWEFQHVSFNTWISTFKFQHARFNHWSSTYEFQHVSFNMWVWTCEFEHVSFNMGVKCVISLTNLLWVPPWLQLGNFCSGSEGTQTKNMFTIPQPVQCPFLVIRCWKLVAYCILYWLMWWQ